MIDAVLYGALGFFIAILLALLFVPLLWNRAVRLTLRRVEATMPMTFGEIQAGKDQLRAEFAVELRRLEVALDKAKHKAVRELVETSKGHVRIDQLNAELSGLRTRLEESESAKAALERTLKRRLPELEAEADSSNQLAAQIETENNELRHRLAQQTETLRSARMRTKSQSEEIARLRTTLQADEAPIKRMFAKSETRLEKENRQLIARLSLLEEELGLLRDRSTEDYLLREEMRKLSRQILQASEAPALPEFAPEPVPADAAETAAALSGEGNAARPARATGGQTAAEAVQSVRKRFRRGGGGNPDSGAGAETTPRSGSLADRLAARARKLGSAGQQQAVKETEPR
jgi:hypothetical protein